MPCPGSTLHAVDDMSFTVGEREIVAVAGESGSGKSTVARVLAKIYKPTSGEVYFQGKPLSAIRSRREQAALQRPGPDGVPGPVLLDQPSLPGLPRGHAGAEAAPARADREQRSAEAVRVFDAVGLNPGAEVLQRYPHELSGGQRQRVGFAQALAMRPKLILADEPVSMLDVSIRIGLLNVMAKLRDERGRVDPLHHPRPGQRPVCSRPAHRHVRRPDRRRQGRSRTCSPPRHPYTQLLLSAVPDPQAELNVSAETDRGEPPRVIDPAPGCRFRFRCPLAIDDCHTQDPQLLQLSPGHSAACLVAQSGAEVKAF